MEGIMKEEILKIQEDLNESIERCSDLRNELIRVYKTENDAKESMLKAQKSVRDLIETLSKVKLA